VFSIKLLIFQTFPKLSSL